MVIFNICKDIITIIKKQILLTKVEQEIRHDTAVMLKDLEQQAKEDAERAEELMPTDGKENVEENMEKQLNDKYKQMNPYGF